MSYFICSFSTRFPAFCNVNVMHSKELENALYVCVIAPVLKHRGVKNVWRSWLEAPRIRNLGTSWKWVVRFTSRPLYPWRKSHRWYPLSTMLGGPVGNWTPVVQTELRRLLKLRFMIRDHKRISTHWNGTCMTFIRLSILCSFSDHKLCNGLTKL